MNSIECQFQLCLYKLQQWATDFRFSRTKMVCMHICQERICIVDLQLELNKSPNLVIEKTKFLGIYFERKLLHTTCKVCRKEAHKRAQHFKVIGNTKWGADHKVMLRLYRSLVRSKLDYGCSVYSSAHKP